MFEHLPQKNTFVILPPIFRLLATVWPKNNNNPMMIVIAFFLKQLRKELSEGGVYSSFSLFTLLLICLNSWGSRKCSFANSKRSRYDLQQLSISLASCSFLTEDVCLIRIMICHLYLAYRLFPRNIKHTELFCWHQNMSRLDMVFAYLLAPNKWIFKYKWYRLIFIYIFYFDIRDLFFSGLQANDVVSK